MTAVTVLATSDLRIGYTAVRRPPKVIVDGINASLKAGELICLIGPNGAGKSTLMRTLAGMQPPLAGSVTLLGGEVRQLPPAELARRLSIVLTERIDAGMLTAYELAALGRYPYTGWMGSLTPADAAIVHQSLQAVDALELAGRQVSELSDGERQKVMIARALAQEPAVMLLDEPTAFLDMPRRAEIMTMLRRLARSTGRAILLSTHDLDLALRTADRLWLLPRGGPFQSGAPEDLILSGAFEAAFRGEGVMFDAYTGSFRSAIDAAGMIDLHGEGLPALWTLRALEREGFCVARWGTDSPIRVEVSGEANALRWQLTRAASTTVYHSLYELLAVLQPD